MERLALFCPCWVGEIMQKIHLVFVRDVLKEAISNDNSKFAKYKLKLLLEIVKNEIEVVDLCVCGNPWVFCACAEEQFQG